MEGVHPSPPRRPAARRARSLHHALEARTGGNKRDRKVSKRRTGGARAVTRHADIVAYNASQSDEDRALCDALASLIAKDGTQILELIIEREDGDKLCPGTPDSEVL